MRIVGLIAAALVLVAGCQGDPDVLEPDPTTSPTPTATPPEMPDQATEDSEEGAAAFVAHWIDVYNYAARTGDGERLRSISPDCDACDSYADALEANAAEGAAPGGDVWELRDLQVDTSTGRYDVLSRIRVRESDGSREYAIGFELGSSAPHAITDVYRVEE